MVTLSSNTAALTVSGLSAAYGATRILHEVSFTVQRGEIVLFIGHNGAGKSTIPRSVMGFLPRVWGSAHFEGQEVLGRSPAQNVRAGMGMVLQGQGIFPGLSAHDNLIMGGFSLRSGATLRRNLEKVHDLFPVLHERRHVRAGALSGGEQRMLSLGIALMTTPRLLFVDEPSIGLSPALVRQVLGKIQELNRELGITIVLVEQNVRAALEVSGRVLVMKLGQLVSEHQSTDLIGRDQLWDLY